MKIRVHKETRPGERRVALVPKAVAALVAAEHEVTVTPGAGASAGFDDAAYVRAGAVATNTTDCDLLVAVGPIDVDECTGADHLIAFLDPLGAPDRIERIGAAGITAYAMEFVPRTTLAQSMDALSSQATVAGYQAVLLAASESPRLFPMLMTAAGTIRPARVLVLGAGVAGLQAIATARRLGAIVAGYDIRPAAREQVESLGASFVGGPVLDQSETSGGYASEVDEATRAAQHAALATAVSQADVVITTAQVPGRTAPVLITAEMVDGMKSGAVIVDLAAPTGGNCELTRTDEVVRRGDVSIHGPSDLSSEKPSDASEMYSRNVQSLIEHLFGADGHAANPDDEIARSTRVTANGVVVSDRVLAVLRGGVQ